MNDLKRRLRERAEYYLIQDSMRRLGKGVPGTAEPVKRTDGLFWRYVFVPLYRRVPWRVKQRAIERLRMTAKGWTPPPREPSEPWKPPGRR